MHHSFLRWIALLAATVSAAAAAPVPELSFNRDIRPIMSDTCFRCHGPDKSSRMAGMRLDIREEALLTRKDGVTPIVPGDPDKSGIIQRIFATDGRVMPPKYAHKDLTDAQKETIRRWVAQGARYEGHWAYQPLRRPAVPDPSEANPIDAFIRTRLAKENLQPSPEADPRVLIRRVTLDLTGLPPTPEEVAAFLADKSPDAYEKLVDRLLASPRYAEMQAIHWLDAVRYADTCGFHGDNPFPAWPYRDYVLGAFRDNKPFDEFTREQLAGDLIPNATTEQKVASAYNRLNRTSAEGGIQPKEYLAKYAADRVRTTSVVWLGSTLGCAECHDHKFDPFKSKDFYSMEAFFADIKETGLVPDKGAKAWGSQLALPTEDQRSRLEALDKQIADAKSRLVDSRPADSVWEKQLLADYDAGKLAWRYQRPTSAAANRAKLTIFNDELIDVTTYKGSDVYTDRKPGDGLVVASGPNPDNETYTVSFKPAAGVWTALGLDVVPDESLPGVRVARGSDRLIVTGVDADITDAAGQSRPLAFALATSGVIGRASELADQNAIDSDPKSGWGVSTYGDNGDLFLALRFMEKLTTEPGSIVTVRIRQDSEYRRAVVGRFRLALSSVEYAWPDASHDRAPVNGVIPGGLSKEVVKALRTEESKRTDDDRKAIAAYRRWTSPDAQPQLVELAKLEAARGLLDAAIPKVVVSEATEPRVMRILPRGNFLDESGAIVEPAIPGFLGTLNTEGRRATRLDLANWVVSQQNPLTARVFANRTWRELFGIGISKVLEDMGSQGEWPTHPELLDWLASEFMHPQWQAENTHDWDVKHLIRTIVLSKTYRQSSSGNPESEERDPDNRLLARQSRFRVDAEVVHDVALSVSGLLVEKFGGPSVRPYEPAGYLAALNFPKREYSESRGDDLYRRAVYAQWQRTFLHPSLQAFDAPTREECTVNRVNSNTPLQALVLLNDPIYVEAARVFAEHMLKNGGRTAAQRIDWAFARAVSRKPTPEERRILLELEHKSLTRFRAEPTDAAKFIHVGDAPVPQTMKPAELAAMTTVARAILNLHETITRN